MTNGGGLAALALDAAGRVLAPAYARRVAAHEAGHFLTAYMSGLLPRGYDLSAAAAGIKRAQTFIIQFFLTIF